jgi:hypothetical protein
MCWARRRGGGRVGGEFFLVGVGGGLVRGEEEGAGQGRDH